jgi:hypothetical protein
MQGGLFVQYLNPRFVLEAREQIHLTGLTIETTDMDPTGGITRAKFHFEKPLEDPTYLRLWWDVGG